MVNSGQRKSLYVIIKKKYLFFIILAVFSLVIFSGCSLQETLFGQDADMTKLTSDDITTAVWNLADWLVQFIGIVLTLYLIYSGYQYLTSMGDKEKIEKAKKSILACIIGVAIVLLGHMLIRTLFNDLFKLNVKIENPSTSQTKTTLPNTNKK